MLGDLLSYLCSQNYLILIVHEYIPHVNLPLCNHLSSLFPDSMAGFFLFLVVLPIIGSLHVSNQHFYHGSTKVFLSGMNLAWKHYGTDFGRNRYHSYSKSTLLGYLNAVKKSGGNSVSE